jgi:hypothetical protein
MRYTLVCQITLRPQSFVVVLTRALRLSSSALAVVRRVSTASLSRDTGKDRGKGRLIFLL